MPDVAYGGEGARAVGSLIGLLLVGGMGYATYKSRAVVGERLRKVLPFVLTAAVSAAISIYLTSVTDRELLRIAVQQQAERAQAVERLQRQIDVIMYTRADAARFPDVVRCGDNVMACYR